MAVTEFVQKDKVLAAQDLPGVPESTPGRIVMVTGLTWIRYRVRFENGVELNMLDARYLSPAPAKKRTHA